MINSFKLAHSQRDLNRKVYFRERGTREKSGESKYGQVSVRAFRAALRLALPPVVIRNVLVVAKSFHPFGPCKARSDPGAM